MSYNVEALKLLRDNIVIEAAHGRHRQESWGRVLFSKLVKKSAKPVRHGVLAIECPTSACAAGWAVVEAGAKMLIPSSSELDEVQECYDCLTPDGQVRGIMEYAAEVLGLSKLESRLLFDGANSTDDVVRHIDVFLSKAEQTA